MFFLKKLFAKKQTKKTPEQDRLPVMDDEEQSCAPVQQYTLSVPKKQNVELHDKCVCVTHIDHGWHIAIQMPAEIILPLINELKNASDDIVESKKMRTVSIVNLEKGKDIYILPNLSNPNKPIIKFSSLSNEGLCWPFYMTPEKRKLIAEQMKTYTR